MILYQELINLSRHIESPFLDRMVIYIGVNFTKMSASIFKKDVVKIILSGKNSVQTLNSILLKLHLCKANGVIEFWLHAQGSVQWDMGEPEQRTDGGWKERLLEVVLDLNTTPMSWTQILGALVVYDTLKCFHKNHYLGNKTECSQNHTPSYWLHQVTPICFLLLRLFPLSDKAFYSSNFAEAKYPMSILKDQRNKTKFGIHY